MTDPSPRPEQAPLDARSLALTLARAAEEFKGNQIRVLDVGSLIFITDFFVLVTTQSSRQTRGLAEELNQEAKALCGHKGILEGDSSSSWLLMDFGNVVVHLLTEEAREFYDLDRLWADAPEVEVAAA